MTLYERITRFSKEKMAKILCDISDCSTCVASEYCHFYHNGFLDWLDEEISDDMYTDIF